MTSLAAEQILRNGSADLLSPDLASLPSSKSSSWSNKLTTVLSSSYADGEIREALTLLDARAIDNHADTRRNLRLDAQKEVIDCNAGILDDFAKVAEQLQRVGAMLTSLNQTCDDMRRHITLAWQESAPMLAEATTLMASKREDEIKTELLKAFHQHFILSDDDLTTLTSVAEPVDDRFFALLARVKQVYKDCEVLLGNENQRLGTDLMEQTTRNLDAAFKKLYTWIQKAFKGLNFEDPQISGPIRRALRVLSERPTLFQNCLDFFAEAREQTLSDAFHQALTETTEGSANPIEFSTHDPLRYVGDMLAWCHATTVSELEALEGLFISDAEVIASGIKSGKNSEPWSRITTTVSAAEIAAEEEDDPFAFDGHKALNHLVSRNVSAIASNLRQRIILVGQQLDDLVLIFKIQRLLAFYQNIFTKILGTDSSLASTIVDLSGAMDAYMQQWVDNVVAGMIHAPALSPEDLSCPSVVRDQLERWREIVKLCDPLTTAADYVYTNTYAQLIKPTLDHYRQAALTLVDPLSHTIFTLNLLQPVHHALTDMEPFTTDDDGLPERVEEEISVAKQAAVSTLHQRLMERSGVAEMIARATTMTEQEREEYAERLDAWLTDVDVGADLAQLRNRYFKNDIIRGAVDLFCQDYAQLEGQRRSVEDVRDLVC